MQNENGRLIVTFVNADFSSVFVLFFRIYFANPFDAFWFGFGFGFGMVRSDEGTSKTFTCARPLVGQYVAIQLVGVEGSLSLCEVEVFSNDGKCRFLAAFNINNYWHTQREDLETSFL